MGSLRELGYDLPSAIADIVDNSIAALARRVDVRFAFDGVDSWILIADDGVGMTGMVLEEAMRYGTERSYGRKELGRFGLGLKTASLSQCRRLTVASRRGRTRQRIEVRRWDLDHTFRRNRWEVLRIRSAEAPPEIIAPLRRHPGTVVLWEGLDRVLDYRIPEGLAAKHRFDQVAQDVAAHLSMVFHRFMAGEAWRRRRVTITLNGVRINPWDPYARSEPETRVLQRQVLPVVETKDSRKARRLVVQPYILPTQERFSSVAAHLRASGPQRWNRQQGFYIYRNDRLIQAGGWNRLRTTDEHTKLARIAVDLPDGIDDVFRVNVSKMRVTLPPSVRQQLAAIASGIAAAAGTSYRRAGATTDGTHHRIDRDAVSDHVPTLISTLSASERDVLSAILRTIREEFREEPDILRRFLSRIERLPLAAVAAPLQPMTLPGSKAGVASVAAS